MIGTALQLYFDVIGSRMVEEGFRSVAVSIGSHTSIPLQCDWQKATIIKLTDCVADRLIFDVLAYSFLRLCSLVH